MWKELKQLHPQDQRLQQPRIRKALIQIPPTPEEFLTKVREQLIVFSCTEQAFIQIPPPPDEFLMEVREQLIVFSSTEQISPIQDIQQECSDSQVFETEPLLFLHTPNIFIEWTYSPPVICNDCAFTEFVQGEERCLKFINQDLTFLQSSSIPSTFSNISNAVSTLAKVREPSHIQLLTCIQQDHIDGPPTQTVEPVLGFILAEIH